MGGNPRKRSRERDWEGGEKEGKAVRIKLELFSPARGGNIPAVVLCCGARREGCEGRHFLEMLPGGWIARKKEKK